MLLFSTFGILGTPRQWIEGPYEYATVRSEQQILLPLHIVGGEDIMQQMEGKR